MKLAIAVVALVGCATSYESATAHQTLGGDAYLVTADGNGWTGASTIEHYKYRRAAELCPGGFDVIDANQSMRTSVATFDGGKTYNTINKPSGSLAIRCKATVPGPPTLGSDGGCGKTPTAPLKPVTGSITGGFSDDEIVNATVQFMVTSGTDIESKDISTHTIVSKRFTGQTLQISCHLNEYRDYAFRIAVVNGTMFVALDCWRSTGNEPYVDLRGAQVPKSRSEITRCAAGGYTSELDATLQTGQIQGTQSLLDLSRTPRAP